MKEQKEFAENLPMETPKVSKEKASKLRDVLNRAKENIKKSKAGQKAADFYAKHEKGVKIGGGVAAGTALAAGLAVGAKKLANKKKEQKEFARADYKGLGETGKQLLRNFRNSTAKDLNKERNQINSKLAEKIKSGSSMLGDFKNFANQRKDTLLKQARSDSRYVKNSYKKLGL